ncbi:MAG: DUF3047 domain-containing protein [Myxococcota bacterium]
MLLVAAVAATAPRASEVVALAAPPNAPWQPLRFRNAPSETRYSAAELDGVAAVRADSHCSASALRLALGDLDLRRTPRLRWRWRVDRPLDVTDERSKRGDDFAARVYVSFRFDPERASFRERIQHRLGRLLYRGEPPGRAINFVWASRAAPGSRWDNPYVPESKMLVLRSGAARGWRDEDVDVLDLYVALIGDEPPPVQGIAIMSDSDDSCQRGTAAFADFRFESRAPAVAP